MNLYKKNLKKLTNSNAYYPSLEHDACGVGLVASTEGKKSRKIVEFGIEVLLMQTVNQEMALVYVLKFRLIFLKKKLKIMAVSMMAERYVLE